MLVAECRTDSPVATLDYDSTYILATSYPSEDFVALLDMIWNISGPAAVGEELFHLISVYRHSDGVCIWICLTGFCLVIVLTSVTLSVGVSPNGMPPQRV